MNAVPCTMCMVIHQQKTVENEVSPERCVAMANSKKVEQPMKQKENSTSGSDKVYLSCNSRNL